VWADFYFFAYLAQRLGNVDTVLGLEVLQDGTDCPRCGGESRVEAVNISFLHIRLLLDSEADLEITALVVRAVADKWLALETYPPGLYRGSTYEQLTSSLNSPWCCGGWLVNIYWHVHPRKQDLQGTRPQGQAS
jgi:hypothetical protein